MLSDPIEDRCEIDVGTSGDSATVTLTGALVAGQALAIVRYTIDDLLERDHTHITVDLSRVVTLDSAGLGEIVHAYTTVRRQGGKFRLLGVAGRVQHLTSLTQMTKVFESSDLARHDNRRNAAVWLTLGVLLTLALFVVTRCSGVGGLA